jgi:repressor LexA
MTDIGIHEGDTVVIEYQTTAKEGDIVVALINNEEAVLRRYYPSGVLVELRPENLKWSTNVYPVNDVQIQGKMVGIYRQY